MLRKTVKVLYTSIFSLIIALAVISSFARLLTPFLNNYRPQIETYLSELLHYSVHIRQLEIGWHWLKPSIQLSEITIGNPKNKQVFLHLHHLAFSFDLQSLRVTHHSNKWKLEGNNIDIKTDKVQFKRLSYELELQHEGNQWLLAANRLTLENPDLIFRLKPSQFQLQEKKRIFDLHAIFTIKQPKRISTYLPSKIMDPDLIGWLNQAFVGKGEIVGYLKFREDGINSSSKKVPGNFQLDLRAKNLDFHYAPDWPIAHHVFGEVHFKDHKMTAHLDKAEIFKMPLKNFDLEIPSIVHHHSVLNIEGKIQDNVDEMSHFILHSPLQEKFKLIKEIELLGTADVNLFLKIPLHDALKNFSAQGDLQLHDVIANVKNYQSKLKHINGNIKFSQSGIDSSNLHAELFQKPLTISLKTELSSLQQGAIEQWKILLNSDDVEGEIKILNQKKSLLLANLKRFYFTMPETTHEGNQWQIKPTDVPSFDIDIEDCRVDHKQLGHVKLKTEVRKNDVIIDNFQANHSSFQMSATGKWYKEDEGFKTLLTGKMTTNNLSDTLQKIDITPAMEARFGELNFKLWWLDNPMMLSFKKLNGELKLYLASGRILHLSDHAQQQMGLVKLLNVLSLQNLPRRLLLDFGDLAKDGLNFNVLKGDFILKKGNAETLNTYLDGQATYVMLSGKIDLGKQNYDLYVHITPYLTSSLPVLATLAGGPLAGAATWMANKLVSSGMKHNPMYTYQILGPWINPLIKESKEKA